MEERNVFLMKPTVFVGFVSSDPVGLINAVARNCYQSRMPESREEQVNFAKRLIELGHLTPLEQVTMRFSLRCARNIADEFMRHRHISVTCSSTRYIDYATNMPVVAPAEDMDDKKLAIFMDAMRKAQLAYADMLAAGGSREEARAMLPLSICADLKVACNLRELRHILDLRTGKAAAPAMRYLMRELVFRLTNYAPELVPLIADVDHSNYSIEGWRHDARG